MEISCQLRKTAGRLMKFEVDSGGFEAGVVEHGGAKGNGGLGDSGVDLDNATFTVFGGAIEIPVTGRVLNVE